MNINQRLLPGLPKEQHYRSYPKEIVLFKINISHKLLILWSLACTSMPELAKAELVGWLRSVSYYYAVLNCFFCFVFVTFFNRSLICLVDFIFLSSLSWSSCIHLFSNYIKLISCLVTCFPHKLKFIFFGHKHLMQ